MRCPCNKADATVHITEMTSPASWQDKHLCEVCAGADLYPANRFAMAWLRDADVADFEDERPCAITGVIINEVQEQQVVMTGELGRGRTFPLVCGIFEATALDRRLKEIESPRPLSHDAWLNTIHQLGGRLEEFVIHRVHDHTYYGALRVRIGGGSAEIQARPVHSDPSVLVEIDVRPSDGLVLAQMAQAPILVNAAILDADADDTSDPERDELDIRFKRKRWWEFWK